MVHQNMGVDQYVYATQYQPGQRTGHYESFFQRANHPTRPLAFWIRYTIFSPHNHPDQAVAELWAIYFDGERNQHSVVKQVWPFRESIFDRARLYVQLPGARLETRHLQGQASSAGHTIAWNLDFVNDEQPLFLLPHALYSTKLPKAKSLVGSPMAIYDGVLTVDGQEVRIDQWIGSQNHNWGRQHTDYYAWGQVAGFDNHATTFLEVASARFKFGPFWTPFVTPIVVRHQGEEVALNTLTQAIRTSVTLRYFKWTFRAETDRVRVEGTFSAPRDAFVGLRYANPPGGHKHCLNSKLASCILKMTWKAGGRAQREEILTAQYRAAFEILTDEHQHGVPIQI